VTTAERVIAQMAAAQHGVVTRAQLLDAGLSRNVIQRRLKNGLLLEQHRGVYRVGHRAPSIEARYMAAVLACRDGALLSGRAAAHLHRLIKGPPPPPEVTAPAKHRISGVRVRRASPPLEGTKVRGIPVMRVPRTIVDLAAELPLDQLARACHEAGVLYGTTPRHVDRILARRPNASGAANLRRILEGDVPVTLSKLERHFLQLLTEHALPLPQTNRPVGAHRVDCHWPEHRLIVELDSYRFHHSRHAWELDRRREREARARGHEFRRFTHRDVFEQSRLMLRELRGLL
jgi:very-short-patch-repair endonuclease